MAPGSYCRRERPPSARYSLDIQIAQPALVPQALLDRMSDEMTRIQLPRTLEAFRASAEGL